MKSSRETETRSILLVVAVIVTEEEKRAIIRSEGQVGISKNLLQP